MEQAPICKSRLLCWVFILPMLLAVCGCGNQTATVSGKVTYLGKVVKGGSVTFVNNDGKTSVSTQINEDGTYKAEKVPVGDVKICIDTEPFNPAKRSKTPKYSPPPGQTAPSGFGEGDTAESMAKRYVKIPEAYAKPDGGVSYTVTSGDQVYDIDLK